MNNETMTDAELFKKAAPYMALSSILGVIVLVLFKFVISGTIDIIKIIGGLIH